MPFKFSKGSITILITGTGMLFIILAVVQFSFNSEKNYRILNARGEVDLLKNNLDLSVTELRDSLAHKPGQSGKKDLIQTISRIAEIEDPGRRSYAKLDLGDKMIRQDKLRISKLFFEQLMREAPQCFFEIERKLLLVHWLQQNRKKMDFSSPHYDEKGVRIIHSHLYANLPGADIVSEECTFDSKSGELHIVLILHRVYPVDTYKIVLSENDHILSSREWNYYSYDENTEINYRYIDCPATFSYEFYYKKYLLLARSYTINNNMLCEINPE